MAALLKRKLGRTGLNVTVLGFGALELRVLGSGILTSRPLAPGQADRLLNAVLDAGINFINTSIDYGMSEEIIGSYISHRRHEYYLASKCGCSADIASGQTTEGPRHVYTRKNIVDGVNLSLKRMKTDYLDLVQFHGAPPDDTRDEAIQALLELKREGKVRSIGVSTVLPDVANLIKLGAFDAFQVPYSALEREHEEIITQAAKAGAGTIIRGGVARGEPGHGMAQPDRWKTWDRAKLGELLDGMSQFEFLLRFTLSHPDLSTTIVGTADPDHLAQNIAAASKGPLPANVYIEAKRRLAAQAPVK